MYCLYNATVSSLFLKVKSGVLIVLQTNAINGTINCHFYFVETSLCFDHDTLKRNRSEKMKKKDT